MSIDSGNLFPWFAIQTKLKREQNVAAQLKYRGYDVYLPLYRKHNRWSDRLVEVECPLFPGYLFCRADCSRPFPIVTVSGVLSIVGRGRQPESVPEQEIAAIRSLLQSGSSVGSYPYLREGERITITRGPLKGVDGFLLKNKNTFKVVVSVNLLQRSVAVELDYEAVRAGSIIERFSCTAPVCIAASPLRNLE